MVQLIHRLDEIEINKIAAGEVIENPASIVKELIENALDAGGKTIRVKVEKGGHEFIEVEDNGSGMEKEDALLCIERHATSKIKKADDLLSLQTMGFRGEALAAISSVSFLEIETSTHHLGTKVFCQGGKVKKLEPFARNRGTTVRVFQLFFNAPPRKKFLKSPSTCSEQIRKVVETIALAHPEIDFSLKIDQKMALDLKASDKRERVEAILGSFQTPFFQEHVWGFLAAPEEAKIQRRSQYCFVNRRPVFSPLLARAVQMGYGTQLMDGLYPPFVLFLELDPKEFDINVHPQKKGVKFSQEKRVFALVQMAVERALIKAPIAKGAIAFQEPILEESFAPFIHPFSVTQGSYQERELSFVFHERPLCILGEYLLLEGEGVYLVDLHRARLRILFEYLMNSKAVIKPLAKPLEISVEDEEGSLALLEKIGVESRMIGKRRIAVDSLPEELDGEEFSDFFLFLKKSKDIKTAIGELIKRSKRTFSLDQGYGIWKKLKECKETKGDPDGNPIWKKLSREDVALWLR